jgi:uncharacterized Tic20 family protein
MSIADELEKLHRLRQSGALDDYEFAQAKTKLLNGSPDAQPAESAAFESAWVGPTAQEVETRRWGLLLHLSVLAGYAVPIAGIVVPIAIWQLKKDALPKIDVHGKNAVNWIISSFIYAAISGILTFAAGIGIPMLMALGVIAVVFPMVAAIKANNGEVWKYPMAISILK